MGKLDNADFSKGGPVDKVLAATRSKGAIYDANLSGNFNWKPNMFRKMPDVGGVLLVKIGLLKVNQNQKDQLLDLDGMRLMDLRFLKIWVQILKKWDTNV